MNFWSVRLSGNILRELMGTPAVCAGKILHKLEDQKGYSLLGLFLLYNSRDPALGSRNEFYRMQGMNEGSFLRHESELSGFLHV